MPGDPTVPSGLTALSLPVRHSDRLVIVRSNDIQRHDYKAWRGHNSDRKILVPPTSSDFSTWVNQDTATITDVDDGCYLTRAAKGSGDSLHCRIRTLPGGTWDVLLGVVCGYAAKQYFLGGICLRESSSGKIATWGIGHGDAGPIFVLWSSATSFNQTPYNPSARGGSSNNVGWFRIRKNGSNMEALWSPDGTDWSLEYSQGITALGAFNTAPNQWGLFINTNNNSTPNLINRTDFIDWDE